MIIVKLGGSVITVKSKVKTLRPDNIQRLVREVASVNEEVILIHGAGSFGHKLAKKYKLNEGYQGDWQLYGLSRVLRDVRELNHHLTCACVDEKLNPVSLAPASFVHFRNFNLNSLNEKLFSDNLQLGMTPLSFGDMVPDEKKGFAVCSGDDLMWYLATRLKPRIAVFATNVDGVFDSNPKEDPSAELLEMITPDTIKGIRSVKVSGDDVTGEMRKKVKMGIEMARAGVDVHIVNGDVGGRLRKTIRGENVKGSWIPAKAFK